jgi:hypothetical protein
MPDQPPSGPAGPDPVPEGRPGDGTGDGPAGLRPFLAGVAGPPAGPTPTVAPTERVDVPAIRPFLLTSGRTRSEVAVALEAQVVSTAEGRDSLPGLSFEYRDIVALCAEPLAIAEVAAQLRLHLGVAQVLIGDLALRGLVTTYQPSGDVGDDVDTILRVINGLRQLHS